MPEYLFQDVKTGKPVDVYMGVDDAVPIGETYGHKGRTLRRLPSMGAGMVEPEYGHTVYGLSSDEAKHFCPRVDADGHGVVKNRREIEETNAKLKAAGRTYQYDFGAHTKLKGRPIR